MKIIRRTCPSGHGSDGSGPKWHAPPCSESAAQKKSFHSQRRGLQRSPSGDPEEESPIPEQLRGPIFLRGALGIYLLNSIVLAFKFRPFGVCVVSKVGVSFLHDFPVSTLPLTAVLQIKILHLAFYPRFTTMRNAFRTKQSEALNLKAEHWRCCLLKWTLCFLRGQSGLSTRTGTYSTFNTTFGCLMFGTTYNHCFP